MNKKVYLHELDCSMETPYEIKRGQWALYDQIVNQGNIVVLSYFEVIDSCTFYTLYNSSEDNKNAILSLLKSGRIKLNGFKDRRTPAQCLIEQIKLYINENEFPYLFSVLDNDFLNKKVLYIREDGKEKKLYNNLLQPLKRSIIYNDPLFFDRLYLNFNKINNRYTYKENNLDEKNYIKYIENYVRMVLEISSIENCVDYDGESNYISIKEIYDDFIDFSDCNNDAVKYTDDKISWNDICDKLKSLSKNFLDSDFNKREQWYIKIDRFLNNANDREKEILHISKAIIDSIYNMSVASSVRSSNIDYFGDGEDSKKNRIETIMHYVIEDYYINSLSKYNDGNTNEYKHIFKDRQKKLNNDDIKNYTLNLDWKYAAFLFENNKDNIKNIQENKFNRYKTKRRVLAFLKAIALFLSYYLVSWIGDLIVNGIVGAIRLTAEIALFILKPFISLGVSDYIINNILDKLKFSGADSLSYSLSNIKEKVCYAIHARTDYSEEFPYGRSRL